MDEGSISRVLSWCDQCSHVGQKLELCSNTTTPPLIQEPAGIARLNMVLLWVLQMNPCAGYTCTRQTQPWQYTGCQDRSCEKMCKIPPRGGSWCYSCCGWKIPFPTCDSMTCLVGEYSKFLAGPLPTVCIGTWKGMFESKWEAENNNWQVENCGSKLQVLGHKLDRGTLVCVFRGPWTLKFMKLFYSGSYSSPLLSLAEELLKAFDLLELHQYLLGILCDIIVRLNSEADFIVW